MNQPMGSHNFGGVLNIPVWGGDDTVLLRRHYFDWPAGISYHQITDFYVKTDGVDKIYVRLPHSFILDGEVSGAGFEYIKLYVHKNCGSDGTELDDDHLLYHIDFNYLDTSALHGDCYY